MGMDGAWSSLTRIEVLQLQGLSGLYVFRFQRWPLNCFLGNAACVLLRKPNLLITLVVVAKYQHMFLTR